MSLREHPSWQALIEHSQKFTDNLCALFNSDTHRFDYFSFEHQQLTLDLSKQRINHQTLSGLKKLAEAGQLSQAKQALFSGEVVNYSEKRPALHTALREPCNTPRKLQGRDINADIHSNLEEMYRLIERLHEGQWRGYLGQAIDTIVNIGVGGSDLGPLMACHALQNSHCKAGKRLQLHFVSTMDGSQLAPLLEQLNPATTLFVISSKSFTTIDTLSNAKTALKWLTQASGVDLSLLMRRHFIGISASPEKMSDWGIPVNNQLQFWEWVGGRYSMWSCIGFPIALKLGRTGFEQFLAGAHDMDRHYLTAPFERNLPSLLALVEIWNINFLKIPSRAILPYDGRLSYLHSYLQQLEMESNGKRTSRSGSAVDYHTCPVVWGELGPNAQHAFYQLLHQGTEAVMCDFIMVANRELPEGSPLAQQHKLTLANGLAQSRVLAFGDQALEGQNQSQHMHYPGNQPSSTLLITSLTPYTLGQMIALYEHKIFTQSVIWDINPFDQWGVELGKAIASQLIETLEGKPHQSLDSSTEGLVQQIVTRGAL